jgi:hypothetical protein
LGFVFFEWLKAGHSVLMENSTNENGVEIDAVENNVLLVFQASIAGPDLFAGSADRGSFCKLVDAGDEAFQIASGLLESPSVDGVVRDFE